MCMEVIWGGIAKRKRAAGTSLKQGVEESERRTDMIEGIDCTVDSILATEKDAVRELAFKGRCCSCFHPHCRVLSTNPMSAHDNGASLTLLKQCRSLVTCQAEEELNQFVGAEWQSCLWLWRSGRECEEANYIIIIRCSRCRRSYSSCGVTVIIICYCHPRKLSYATVILGFYSWKLKPTPDERLLCRFLRLIINIEHLRPFNPDNNLIECLYHSTTSGRTWMI